MQKKVGQDQTVDDNRAVGDGPPVLWGRVHFPIPNKEKHIRKLQRKLKRIHPNVRVKRTLEHIEATWELPRFQHALHVYEYISHRMMHRFVRIRMRLHLFQKATL